MLDGHHHTTFISSSKSTYESISCISNSEENTYDFDKEIDIQDDYDNFDEETLKLNEQNIKLYLKYMLLKKKKKQLSSQLSMALKRLEE